MSRTATPGPEEQPAGRPARDGVGASSGTIRSPAPVTSSHRGRDATSSHGPWWARLRWRRVTSGGRPEPPSHVRPDDAPTPVAVRGARASCSRGPGRRRPAHRSARQAWIAGSFRSACRSPSSVWRFESRCPITRGHCSDLSRGPRSRSAGQPSRGRPHRLVPGPGRREPHRVGRPRAPPGGAVGNLTDRLRLGYVIDYVDAGLGDVRSSRSTFPSSRSTGPILSAHPRGAPAGAPAPSGRPDRDDRAEPDKFRSASVRRRESSSIPVAVDR